MHLSLSSVPQSAGPPSRPASPDARRGWSQRRPQNPVQSRSDPSPACWSLEPGVWPVLPPRPSKPPAPSEHNFICLGAVV